MLREAKEPTMRLPNVLNQLNDAVFLLNPRFDVIVDANPKACALLGYSRSELVSVGISAIHPDEIQEFRMDGGCAGRGIGAARPRSLAGPQGQPFCICGVEQIVSWCLPASNYGQIRQSHDRAWVTLDCFLA